MKITARAYMYLLVNISSVCDTAVQILQISFSKLKELKV